MSRRRSTERQATRQRDLGVERLGRTTRVVTLGAVGLTGVFSAAAAVTLPGHSKASTPTAATPATTLPAGSATPAATSGGGTLQPPTQAPAPTTPPTTPAPVTSGGS